NKKSRCVPALKSAQNRTRTCTSLRTLPPQSSASTNSAIWAKRGQRYTISQAEKNFFKSFTVCRGQESSTGYSLDPEQGIMKQRGTGPLSPFHIHIINRTIPYPKPESSKMIFTYIIFLHKKLKKFVHIEKVLIFGLNPKGSYILSI